jgi:uncharacterized phage-associated protein
MTIRFKFSEEKALEALCWIARKWPGITPFYVAKVMFYAEKRHLNTYGRPIIADTFIAMKNGPVPSTIRDFIQGNYMFSPIAREIHAAINVDRRKHHYGEVHASREPDLGMLSASDIECLDEALNYCRPNGRPLSFAVLSNGTHLDRAWLNASLNQAMDYADFIDEDNPHRDEIVEMAHQHAAHGVL